MRAIWLLAAAVAAPAILPAQIVGGRGAFPFRTFGSPTGFGNINFPATGTPPPITVNFGASFAQRLGATVSGNRGFLSSPVRGRGRGGFVVPFAVPVFVGGYGGYGYENPYPYGQQEPPVTVVAPPQPAQPPVIINQYYTSDTARPVMRDYSQENLPQPESSMRTYTAPPGPSFPEPNQSKASLFLIAFKDGSIYPAIAYWVEGNTVNYITKDGVHNRATIDRVDQPFSEQLNRERGLDFKLPKQ